MDNDDLDDLLKSKFKTLQTPPLGASLVPGIMTAVAAAPELEALLPKQSKRHDWVVMFALLMGALVCLPSFSAVDVQALSAMLPSEMFGSYGQAVKSAATNLLLPGLVALVMLPVAWIMIED